MLTAAIVILTALLNVADRHWVMMLTRRRQEASAVERKDLLRSLRDRAADAHDVEDPKAPTERPAKKPYAYAEGL